ncbi:MAG: DUF6476 family protein [Pseudomonadota bacterium]
MPNPSETDDAPSGRDWGASPQFRSLRRMVAILTATLSIGVTVIAATLVFRIVMEDGPPAVTTLGAESVAVPADEIVIAAGATPSALSLVTRAPSGAETLRVFHPQTGDEVRAVRIERD